MIALFPSRTVALEIAGFGIHWYGLLYFAAFAVAWWLLPRLQKYRGLHLTGDEWSTILSWGVVGVIVGGRLGFVFFYEPAYFLVHPLEVFAVWHGGMSSHGGFIGVTLALWYALRHKKGQLLAIADCVVVPVAIGLAFGRIGNFINQELYGTVTTLPWGISVPGVDGLRHPTQIYAVIKDLFIAVSCFMVLRGNHRPGSAVALFLMLYAVLRFTLEFFRQQTESTLLSLGPIIISTGQLLTTPLLFIGVWVWMKTQRGSVSKMNGDGVGTDRAL